MMCPWMDAAQIKMLVPVLLYATPWASSWYHGTMGVRVRVERIPVCKIEHKRTCLGCWGRFDSFIHCRLESILQVLSYYLLVDVYLDTCIMMYLSTMIYCMYHYACMHHNWEHIMKKWLICCTYCSVRQCGQSVSQLVSTIYSKLVSHITCIYLFTLFYFYHCNIIFHLPS